MRGGYYANVSFMYPTLDIFSMFQGMVFTIVLKGFTAEYSKCIGLSSANWKNNFSKFITIFIV